MGTKDFTRVVENEGSGARAPKPITFTRCGEHFDCLARPPAAALADIAVSSGTPGPESVAAAMQFLDLVLTDESAERFAAMMRSKDPEYLIELEEVFEILGWLLEQYNPPKANGGSDALPSGPNRTTRRSTRGALSTG
jgi:hypothetical protein